MAGVGVPPQLATVLSAPDGVTRCRWATETGRDLTAYHDHEWGIPTHDEAMLFEALALTYFENGLSWAIVFDKRNNLRAAFHGFDPGAVAEMTPADVERLMVDTSIIRNRRKIEATLHNARLLTKHSLSQLVWRTSTAHTPSPPELGRWPDGKPRVAAALSSVASSGVSTGRPRRCPLVHADRRDRERSFRGLFPRSGLRCYNREHARRP